MIETSLMVHDYPEPPEVKEKPIKRTVILAYEVEVDVPECWEEDEISEYIKNNLGDYIDPSDYEDIEIEN